MISVVGMLLTYCADYKNDIWISVYLIICNRYTANVLVFSQKIYSFLPLICDVFEACSLDVEDILGIWSSGCI